MLALVSAIDKLASSTAQARTALWSALQLISRDLPAAIVEAVPHLLESHECQAYPSVAIGDGYDDTGVFIDDNLAGMVRSADTG